MTFEEMKPGQKFYDGGKAWKLKSIKIVGNKVIFYAWDRWEVGCTFIFPLGLKVPLKRQESL